MRTPDTTLKGPALKAYSTKAEEERDDLLRRRLIKEPSLLTRHTKCTITTVSGMVAHLQEKGAC